MSQPAVSNALSRLRQHLGDPLFERVGQGIEPTPRAALVAPQIAEALRAIEEALAQEPSFDPHTHNRDFSILLPDAIEHCLMLPLLNLRQQYPGITYSLLPLGTNDPTDVLLNRRADIVFSVDPIRHKSCGPPCSSPSFFVCSRGRITRCLVQRMHCQPMTSSPLSSLCSPHP